MNDETLQKQADEIGLLLEQKMRIRGRSFATQVRKVDRRMPKKLRADLARIVETLETGSHPKFAHRVDYSAASQGADRVIAHLGQIDRWEMFKDRWLSILGAVSAALIVTFILVVWVLVQRGLV